mgnify:FL=1
MRESYSGKLIKAPTERVIENLDSPYDSIFGEEGYDWLTTNNIVINIGKQDAVVCLEQGEKPFKTIRNEFVSAENSFTMTNIPFGKYKVKVYEGKNWDFNFIKPLILIK